MISFLNNFFQLKSLNTNIKTEFNAGLTTFLTMSYIIFVNPLILGDAGMDRGSIFIATILIACFATLLMGLYANWPLALAPGMGANAWFTYGIVLQGGHSWQIALGAVFLSGIVMLLFSLSPLRKKLLEAMPISLKMSIATGVGLFIALIGFKTSGILVSNTHSFADFGSFKEPSVILTFIGLIIIFICESLKIRASFLISIFFIAIASCFLGITHFTGIISSPPSISPTLFKLDLKNLFTYELLGIVFTLFIIDFFDSTSLFIGTMSGVSKHISPSSFKKALSVDSMATSVGALLGVSTTTTYSESIAGVSAGGRSGLVAVVVGLLFLLMLFFSPLLSIMPSFVASSVMIYIGCLMLSSLKHLDWEDITEVIPLLIILIVIPLTFSIFNGVGLSICAWLLLKIIFKKWKAQYIALIPVALAFLVFMILK